MRESRPTVAAAPLPPADETLWSTLAHFGTVVGFLPSLLILLLVGPRSARVQEEAGRALDFALTACIALVALWVLGAAAGGVASIVPRGADLPFLLLGFLIGLVAFGGWVLVVALSIAAAVRVHHGASFRYPFSLRLVERLDPVRRRPRPMAAPPPPPRRSRSARATSGRDRP
ncbi:hypothetical protein GCM10025783_15620 [Amnibacterium soli]|uniref:DUF4870 domain-containing protein n=1 Tax=Amnibacterium soli TaxID=1282736 RepID=A0ABP8Z2M1_9MICO